MHLNDTRKWENVILEGLESGEENEKPCNHNVIKIVKQKK